MPLSEEKLPLACRVSIVVSPGTKEDIMGAYAISALNVKS